MTPTSGKTDTGSASLSHQLDLAVIAHRHYLKNMSATDIAAELGISRFAVGRALAEARERGIIRFSIELPSSVDVSQSLELKDAFGLVRCTVVTTPSEEAHLTRSLIAETAVDLAKELVKPTDIIGITAGRTLGMMANLLQPMRVAGVVQLSGVAGTDQNTAVQVVLRFAQKMHAKPYPLFAPLIASDPAAAAAIRRQLEAQRTLEHYPKITRAFVAIGSWNPVDSELRANPLLKKTTDLIIRKHQVLADIGGVLITAEGTVVQEANSITIGATAATLKTIPEVIAVAGGITKANAIKATLRSGVVDSLITDSVTAAAILNSI
jgi:DNA-binding transcriptional regulator LsrR (DeoR family)